MIFYILSALIIGYSLINFKKSFMLFLGFKMFLNSNITLISVPGIPILTLDMAVTLYFILNMFFHKGKYQMAKKEFPYRNAFLLLFMCWFISAMFSIAGFSTELSVLTKNITNKILFIWMLWQIIETKDDFKEAFKIITIVFFASTLYGLFEASILSNPLMEYERELNNDVEKIMNWSYAESGRGYRINSIFEHAIGAGMNWAVYAVFTLGLFIDEIEAIPRKYFSFITVGLCIICMFFSRSRTPLIYFGIALVGMFNFKKKSTYGWFVALIIVCIIFLPNLPSKTIQIISSIFNTNIDVGGSTFSARLDQISAAWSLMKQSFFFGMGPKYSQYINNIYVQRLLGGESIWLGVLPSYGFFGIVCYLFEMFTMIYVVPKKYNSGKLFFLGLAYWMANTVSSFPGFLEYLYFLCLFFLIKNTSEYKNINVGIKRGIYFNGLKIHYQKKQRQ